MVKNVTCKSIGRTKTSWKGYIIGKVPRWLRLEIHVLPEVQVTSSLIDDLPLLVTLHAQWFFCL